MNIWNCFVPGSGASVFEMLLRTCTSMQGLPVTKDWLTENTAHGEKKQWHPNNKKDLLEQKYISAIDNVFTPIVPMADFTGTQVLDYVSSQKGIKIYTGPSTDIVSEFALIAGQKVPGYPTNMIPKLHNSKWSETDLEQWEQREYLSLYLLQWWLPHMRTQWQHARQLGFYCIDTMDVFKDLEKVFYNMCKHIGVDVTKETSVKNYCKKWTNAQKKIWKDWKSYVEYKDGKQTTLTGDIIQESMIQYHLRERGIELKCYGLNTFPNSEELKQYYE